MKRCAIVLVLGLPSALAAGLYGALTAAFAGDANPSWRAHQCWILWGVFGGACVGAIPGLIAGLSFGMRWTIPLLGAALGALPGLLEVCGFHISANTWRLFGGPDPIRSINLAGYFSAASVVTRFLMGLLVCWASAPRDGRQRTASPRQSDER